MIPTALRDDMSKDSFYSFCAREGEECKGRITWEHAWIYAGKQINEKWAIIPLCEYHHLGAGLEKEFNRYIALSRANIEDIEKRMPKKNWRQQLKHLSSVYENRYKAIKRK